MKNTIIIVVIILASISCGSNGNKTEVTTSDAETLYKDWQVINGENVKFQYPKNWRISIQNVAPGVKRFGLTDDSDTTNNVFFPAEIWELSTSKGTFNDFAKYVPNEYFKKSSDGDYANLLSSDTIKFKSLEAITFNYKKNDHPVQVTAVNGLSKYYLLINYIHESTIKQATSIFNSVVIRQN